MLSALGLAAPSLKLRLHEDIVFLHPTGNGEPSEDPVLRGSVTLFLPKARKLRHLKVRLMGHQDLSWPEGAGYESTTTVEKVVSLVAENGLALEKGEHVFEFSIIVPSSTAPYERCSYGRVYHTVSAKAKGMGVGGSDVTESCYVFIVQNPGGAGVSSPPPPLDLKVEEVNKDFGPFALALESQHVMVSGLILLRIKFLHPITRVFLQSVKLQVLQDVTIESRTDSKRPKARKKDPITIFMLDKDHLPNDGQLYFHTNEPGRGRYPSKKKMIGGIGGGGYVAESVEPEQSRSRSRPPSLQRASNPGSRSQSRARFFPGSRPSTPSHSPSTAQLATLEPETPYNLVHIARLSNDNVLRPSTLDGAECSIKISHDFVVEIRYSVCKDDYFSGPVTLISITKPVVISSCSCFVDSLTLPEYSEEDPLPERPQEFPPCLCTVSTENICEVHGYKVLMDRIKNEERQTTFASIQK